MLNINRKLLKYNILANYSFNFYSVAEKCRNVRGIEVIVACGVELDTQYSDTVSLLAGDESRHRRDIYLLFAGLRAFYYLHFAA